VPSRRDWPKLLGELAGQLNDGRVYDQDLPALARALQRVLETYRRRPPHRRPRYALKPRLQDFSSRQTAAARFACRPRSLLGARDWEGLEMFCRPLPHRRRASLQAATSD
jgi:hypothetical protein